MDIDEDPFFHLKWETEYRYILFRDHCIDTVNAMKWKNNISFQPDITIEEAQEKSIHGLDAGRLGAFMVMPPTKDYYQWVKFWRYLRHCQANLDDSIEE